MIVVVYLGVITIWVRLLYVMNTREKAIAILSYVR